MSIRTVFRAWSYFSKIAVFIFRWIIHFDIFSSILTTTNLFLWCKERRKRRRACPVSQPTLFHISKQKDANIRKENWLWIRDLTFAKKNAGKFNQRKSGPCVFDGRTNTRVLLPLTAVLGDAPPRNGGKRTQGFLKIMYEKVYVKAWLTWILNRPCRIPYSKSISSIISYYFFSVKGSSLQFCIYEWGYR